MELDYIEEIENDSNSISINRKKTSYNQSIIGVNNNNNNLSTDLSPVEKLKALGFSEQKINDILTKHSNIRQILEVIKNINIKSKVLEEKFNKLNQNFSFEVDISNDKIIKKAMRQIYKKPLNTITYEQYKNAKEKLNVLYQNKLKEEIDE